MTDFVADIQIKGAERWSARITDLKQTKVKLQNAVILSTNDLRTEVVRQISKTLHKTGNLGRSIITKFKDDHLTGLVGTNIVYARIHEFGGFIRPKQAKNLTIPLNRKAELTTAREMFATNPKRMFFANPKGNLILFMNMGKGVPPQAMYVLKKEVYIPPRPYMRPSLHLIKPKFIERIKASVRGA